MARISRLTFVSGMFLILDNIMAGSHIARLNLITQPARRGHAVSPSLAPRFFRPRPAYRKCAQDVI